MIRETLRRQIDCGDDLVGTEIRVDMRRVARQLVELRQRNRALAVRPGNANGRLQRR